MQKEKTVGRQCVGTQIADILEERILQNIYPVGGKLPPERQLAEEFGVSRQSLRAALRILSARGMPTFPFHGNACMQMRPLFSS